MGVCGDFVSTSGRFPARIGNRLKPSADGTSSGTSGQAGRKRVNRLGAVPVGHPVVEDVGQPARERLPATRPVSRVNPLGVVAESRLHALESEVADEILESLLVHEPTQAGELVVSDLPAELEQALAGEAVRAANLVGCAAHSSGVYRRRRAVGGRLCV
jgi:hypothetical protein